MPYLLTNDAIDPARSLPLYTEAFACAKRSGDHLINSFLHNNAGYNAMKDLPAARAHLEAAAQAGQQIGYQDQGLMANLGWVLRAQGDPEGARSLFEAALRDSRRYGDNNAMASVILALACLATDGADWHKAAALHGSAQAIRDRAGMHWEELEARFRQDSLDQARAHLGDEQLERAYTQGTTLSIENALDLALPRAGPA